MLTIYDIAKACNLAPSTVSKVLNNYAGVSQSTKEIVCATAERLGYLPNSIARSLNTKSSRNIGAVIYIHDDYPSLKHRLFTSILNEFKARIEKHNYDLTFVNKKMEFSKGSFLNHCKMKRMDGVVLFGDFTNPKIEELIYGDIPAVAFDYAGSDAVSVVCNNGECAYELTNHLLQLGHRDIVYICGDMNAVSGMRLSGHLQAMRAAGIEQPQENIVYSRYGSYNANAALTKTILTRDRRPTAIMFPDDISAIGGYSACYDLGLKIPDDISVTGFDGIDFGSMIRPRLTTVKQNIEEIGRVMAEKLFELIAFPQTEKQAYTVSASIFTGESCKRF